MQELTPEEKALLDDFLLDGEDFSDLVITPGELPIAKSLAEKKLLTLNDNHYPVVVTVSSYKTPLQKYLDYVDDIDEENPIPPDELSDEEKAQVLEYLKIKFRL